MTFHLTIGGGSSGVPSVKLTDARIEGIRQTSVAGKLVERITFVYETLKVVSGYTFTGLPPDDWLTQ